MPMNMRSFELSLWFSSATTAVVGGVEVDDIVAVGEGLGCPGLTRAVRCFLGAILKRGLQSQIAQEESSDVAMGGKKT